MSIYKQVCATKRSSSRNNLEMKSLKGLYGLVKTRDGHENSVSNLFAFELDTSRFDDTQWQSVLKSVPTDYMIPDPKYIEILSDAHS